MCREPRRNPPFVMPQRPAGACKPRLWLLALAALVSYLPGFAQQTYDPDQVLLSVRDRLLPELQRLPRYTCVQTVTRRYYRGELLVQKPSCAELIAAHDWRMHELTLRSWDRLRMEVAIADGKNVFSWVGAPKFEEGALEKLAAGGPLGSGDFGPFLHSILRVAAVSFQEEQVVESRRLLRYAYQMPLNRSQYHIKGDKGWMLTGYSGTFLLDPLASDIVAVSVRSNELPENKAVCQARTEIDYGRVAIHDRSILIPRETRLRMIGPDGSETLSTTEYSNCREYSSQSRLFFDRPEDHSATAVVRNPAAPGPLPADLRLLGRIVTPIDSETAAAGDPIEAVLRKPLRGANNVTLAPAGALLHARLKRVEQWSGGYTQIALQFETIEVNGATISLRARADLAPLPASRGAGSMLVSRDPTSLDTTTFTLRGEHLHLRQFDWGWTTLPADSKNDDPF